VEFLKMEGLGNDFVVIASDASPTRDDVVAWCDRRRGIGGDGVLVASPAEGGVRMRYWNADGSTAATCGNGVRCVARLAVDREWVSPGSFTVFTDAGPTPVAADVTGDVRAHLGVPSPPGPDIEIAGYTFSTVSLGNPHAVTIVPDPFAFPVSAVGPIVEGDPAFPERTNVEFVAAIDRSRLAARIWERGVGETLASGTGGAAAAVVAHRAGLAEAAVTVELAGGKLRVEIGADGVWTEGPAVSVFSGNLA
jgi:diaminopimelate epimerase